MYRQTLTAFRISAHRLRIERESKMLFIETIAVMISVTMTQQLPDNILPIDPMTDSTHAPPAFCHQLQCPQYTLLGHNADYEIRQYAPSVWVGTSASNVDKDNYKTSPLFQKLFRYIDHGNTENKKIPMTAPVVTMIVPTSGNMANISMYFMIPFALQGNPPQPNATDVTIEHAPVFTVYVKSYSGFNLFHQADKQLAQLKQQLGSLNKYDTTVYYTAGYDSPFSFTNRHNEVWLMASDNGSPEVSVVGRR